MTLSHARIRLRAFLTREDGWWAGDVALWVGTMMLVLFAGQVTTWFIGVNAAQQAAGAAYTIARAYDAHPEDGEEAALQLLDALNGSLREPTVTVARANETVTVTVTGEAIILFPGLWLPPVTHTQVGPVERWVPAQ